MMKNILIITGDMYLRSTLTAILSNIQDYNLLFAQNLDTALVTILGEQIDMVLVHQNLGGLHGLDLIAVVARVKPDLPFILFDDDMSARTAMAAFRLGAKDYMTYPPRPHLLLMQINRCLSATANMRTRKKQKISEKPVDYASLLDPEKRALTLALDTDAYHKLHSILEETVIKVEANMVGIIDKSDNIVDAVGNFASLDVRQLKRIIGFDTQSNHALANVIGIDRFTATFWEGEAYNVYMIEIIQVKALLLTITSASIKAGAVWTQLKVATKAIRDIISSGQQTPVLPIFS